MRPRRLFGLWFVLVVLVSPWSGAMIAEEPSWKAGTAAAKITPEKPLWLAGYGGRNHPVEGTLHDLWIKVLALEAPDGHRGVVLSSDILGFPKDMSDKICAELKQQCGLDRAQIMLTSSHTHTGPVLREALYDIYPLDDEQVAMIEEYSLWLEKTVVATVAEALSGLKPVTLWASEGTTDFAVNRRNNRAGDVLKLRESGELKGPSDHDVPVLAVRGPDGQLPAVVFGYACHCTTLSLYQWSGDYAGFAQIALERGHPGTLAMFHAGCGADQNPLPRRSVELCQKYGEMLSAAVDEVLAKKTRPVAPRLRTAFEIVNLDYGKQPTAAELKVTATKGSYQGRWATRLLKKLQKNGPFDKSYPYPVQVWKLGADQLWIVMGGEVVVDYSLKFKAQYGPQTWVTGYANDVMSYIPSQRVWKEGGYESGAFFVYGLPAERWTPDIEELIAASVARLVESLK